MQKNAFEYNISLAKKYASQFVVTVVGEMKGGKVGVQKTKMDHHHHPVKFV